MDESPSYVLRAARESDMPLVAEMYAYYVANTVVTFYEETPPLDQITEKYRSSLAAGLPYIVAVPPGSSPHEPATSLLGYACASGFRGMKGAYRMTVELSLYCHPDHQGKGVGTALLKTLLEALKDPGSHADLFDSGPGGVPPRAVKQVLAVMSVDPDGKRGGLALKEFYEGFGFVLRGHLKEVGYKFGKWIDTMYLQLTL